MARELKMYCRSGFRSDCPPEEDRHGQTREYVAAHSKADAARCYVASGPRDRVNAHEISESEWPVALTKCMDNPLTVFWCAATGNFRSNGPIWHVAAPKGGG